MGASKHAVISWGTVISILAAGNLFFINRLVSTIDSTEKGVMELKLDMVAVKTALKIQTEHAARPAPRPVAKRAPSAPKNLAWVLPKQ